MKELIKELRASSRLFRPVEHRAADALEAQQARIAELREALSRYIHIMYEEDYAAKALSRTDDLSALVAHDAEVRKIALLMAAEWFKPKHTYEEMNVGLVQEKLRRMAEGEGK